MKTITKAVFILLLAVCTLVSCNSDTEQQNHETEDITESSYESSHAGSAISAPIDVIIGGESTVPCIVNTQFSSSDIVVADVIATDAAFGADPTGVKDSTDAINSAIDECYDLGGGTVWLPAGTYKISSAITIHPMVTLRGDYVDPDTVTDGNYGTVISVQYNNDSDCAVLLRQNSGVKGLTFYYPYQNADAPKDFGWTIEYRGNEGSQGPAIEYITLLNSYDGIGLSADDYEWNANSNMYLNHIKGTVLNRGLVVNNNSGACSYQNMNFSPEYWANSTEAYNAPPFEKLSAYTRKNAEAFVLGGLEMPMIHKLSASHYRYGIHIVNGGSRYFWGAGMSFLNITETDVALKIDSFWSGRMAGIVRSVLMGSEASVEIVAEGVSLFLTDCNLSHPPKGESILCRYPQTTPETYEESETVLKPARAVLYDVTKAPYSAPCESINTENRLGNDCTAAIQQALNDAGEAGGGIVYLPAGHYVIKGNLTIPAGVELRGAGAIPMTPGPSGGTLIFLYAGKDSENSLIETAGITVAGDGGGIRQIQIYYPENPFASEDSIIAFPYAIRYDNAVNSYGVNIYFSNPYRGIDVADGSDRNYLRAISGTAANGFIRIGKANDCYVETIHDINPGYWTNAYRYGTETTWMSDISAYFHGYQKANCNTVTSNGAENLRLLNVLQFGGRCTLEVTGGSAEAWNILLDQGGQYCIKVNSGIVTVMNSELTGQGSQVNLGELTAYNEYYIK